MIKGDDALDYDLDLPFKGIESNAENANVYLCVWSILSTRHRKR
jgi:hypothetical protein